MRFGGRFFQRHFGCRLLQGIKKTSIGGAFVRPGKTRGERTIQPKNIDTYDHGERGHRAMESPLSKTRRTCGVLTFIIHRNQVLLTARSFDSYAPCASTATRQLGSLSTIACAHGEVLHRRPVWQPPRWRRLKLTPELPLLYSRSSSCTFVHSEFGCRVSLTNEALSILPDRSLPFEWL